MPRKPASFTSLKKLPAKRGSRHTTEGITVAPPGSKKDYRTIISRFLRNHKELPKTAMPSAMPPMLATLVKEPFNDPDWIFEIKWDGYRALGYINEGAASLRSRSQLPFHNTYTPVYEALKDWPINAVVDGEIVVVQENGKSDFDALQRWQRTQEGQLLYYVFDLLWLEGIDLTGLPLVQRKEILRQLVPEQGLIKFSDSIDEYGIDFYHIARTNELEGIVGKNKNSTYDPGRRSAQWLKVPTEMRQEFVIGGWTESGSNRPFRSLLFGYYEGDRLIPAGHAGGGFKDSEMPRILQKLQELEVRSSPFAGEVTAETRIHWVRPELVAEIKYATLTSGGKIRKPAIFLGFREDKPAKEVQQQAVAHGPVATKKKAATTAIKSNWVVVEQVPVTSSGSFIIEGHELELTNVEKELWKGISKADLVRYYHEVSPLLLPHLLGRPQSLHIKHIAPAAPGLYIKDMEGRQPGWAEIYSMRRKHKKKDRRDEVDYLVCNGEASLLFMVNLGCIDINPWTSRAVQPEQPDYIIIDLDPSDDDFTKVIETALAAKEFFDRNSLRAFPKTSGKTGLHLYLPCSGFSFPQARTIAQNICAGIHTLVPQITTTEVSIDRRGARLYLDPNQNDFADTVAAPYTVRPYHLPTVSTPLEWKEIKPTLDPHAFTLHSINRRLEKKGDLFLPVLDPKIANRNNGKLKGFL